MSGERTEGWPPCGFCLFWWKSEEKSGNVRANIWIVYVFFQGTIEDNLFRVAPNVGHRELEDIFYISGFDEHLNKLPDGIHSRIDENASQLSNAAMNLLALTRALLVNPEVLLFDEFFSL